MGQFLRDQLLRNVTIDEAALEGLEAVFRSRLTARNQQLFLAAQAAATQGAPAAAPQAAAQSAAAPAQAPPAAQAAIAAQPPPQLPPAQSRKLMSQVVFWHYIIRFDGKGYRFTDFADVKKHFTEARKVERVVFTMDSRENRETNGLAGTSFELWFDAVDSNHCRLNVSSDDRAWTDETFAAVMDVVSRHRNSSGYVRTQWTLAAVQVLGVSAGFAVSVWAASVIAPQLSVENAFAVALIFAFLVFSNVWGYLNAQFWRLIDAAFPNIRFKQKDKDDLNWLAKAVLGGLTVAIILAVWRGVSDLFRALFASVVGS